MKISPINNNQPQFRAKLPKSELNSFVSSALTRDKNAGIPKLYTLLEQLDKTPGDKAEIKSLIKNNQSSVLGFGLDCYGTNHCQLRIDGKLVGEGSNIYDTLYSAMTSAKTKDGRKISMPQSVFDIMWWENRDKTVQDMEQFLRD